MRAAAFLVVFCLATPAIAIRAHATRGLQWLDPVIVCYLAGLFIANATPLMAISEAKTAATQVTELTLPLAIPMLLFATDFKS